MKPLTPTTPHVIIMVGIPGSGKTTFAQHFADTFHAPYINPSDISQQTGFDDEATEKVTELLFNELMKTKRTLVYEGSTYTRQQRDAIVKLITPSGYKTLFVWVQTEPMEAKRRATSTKRDHARLSSAEFNESFALFQNPAENERAVVISGRHTFATQVKGVLKRLAVARPQPPAQRSEPRAPRGRNINIR